MIIVSGLDGDETAPVVTSTPLRADPAKAFIAVVGAGNRGFVFSQLTYNPNNGIGVNDWSGAITCTADEAEMTTAINTMLADPPYGAIQIL